MTDPTKCDTEGCHGCMWCSPADPAMPLLDQPDTTAAGECPRALLVAWHETMSRELYEAARAAARDRYPAGSELLVRRVALELLRSARGLAFAGNAYQEAP